MAKTKNDKAWEKLFDEYDILQRVNTNGNFIIESRKIGKYRESRLMTKFDHESNLPIIFKDNQLSILPVSRGSYIIGRFKNYKKVNYDVEDNLIYKGFPTFVESININN